MEENKRIRLLFKDDYILSEEQKASGLNRSWLLLKPQHHTVADIESHLLHSFRLQESCPHGLVLTRSGFVLPPFELTNIIKDSEVIRVQKRRLNLRAEVHGVLENQPLNNGILLLANEEFEKEKGGYESDDPEEESGVRLEDKETPEGGNADANNRKRKAPEKLQGSKKKKHRAQVTEKAESSLKNSDSKEGKSLSCEEEKDNANVERNVEVQEINKETEDAKVVPQETKKVPSRSARRKYVKRRWLREMAKIQKQNATCESEGLRNWKEDHAKSEQKMVDGQSKRPQKWKKQRFDGERNEVDGQPKGLLHLKLSPQGNKPDKGRKRKQPNQIDYIRKHPNQNGDGLEQPNQKQVDDVHEQPCQKSSDVQEHPNQNCEELNEESDEDNEVIPVVIRPGHIRFEPIGKEKAVQQENVPTETIHQWNGITSKKKGQQWGKENRSFVPRNDPTPSNKECSDFDKGQQPREAIAFDKLPLLLTIPKEGDLIAYRLLELSTSWTPELSTYRVGKVYWYSAKSNQIMLVPVPEYPVVSEKADEDDENIQRDNSLYKEDGSLEIDFSSLIDPRIFEHGISEVSDLSTSQDIGKQAITPTPETDVWEQLSEALNAKKEQLSTENGWEETPKNVQQPLQNSWTENDTNVQPSPESSWGKKVLPSPGSNRGKNIQKVPASSSWGKDTQKVQASSSKDKSWGKQGSGGGNKSWSYKALRGSALGPTMALLRSKNDDA